MACKFCNIAKHVKPEHIIYEDDLVMAFMSIEQLTKSHILVIPKRHYKDIFALDEKIAERIFRIVTRLSKIVKQVVRPDGLDIYECNGKVAGQIIMHFHMHVFPRFKGDGLFKIYGHRKPLFRNDKYLEKVARKIKSQL